MSPRARQVLWGFLFSNLSYQTTGRSMIKVELENLPRCLSSLLAVRIKMSHWLGEMSPTQDVLIGSPIFTLRAFLRLLRLLRSFHRKHRRHIHESPHSASQRPDLYAPVRNAFKLPDPSPGTSSARREDLAEKSAKKSLPLIFGTPFSYLYDNTLRL